MASTTKAKLLFLTSPEAGQANVQLGTIASIQTLHGEDLDIYLGSFEQLRKRCPENVTFLPVQGKGMIQHFLEKYDDSNINNAKEGTLYKHLTTPTGIWGAIRLAFTFTTIIHSESPEEYVSYAKDVERLILELEPDFIVCDTIFECGRDAIKKLGRKCIYLSPNTFKDLAGPQQKTGIFKWPCAGTRYPYPLPWYLYPLNVFGVIFFVTWLLKYDKRHIEFNKVRNAAGYEDRLPIFQKKDQLRNTFLCVSHPEVEYPGRIPRWLKLCGPILLPTPSLEETDLELYEWVMKRPTILIVLGTHYKTSKELAENMLISLKIVLEKRRDIQVLWKLQKYGTYDLEGYESDTLSDDRIKIVSWLNSDPLAVLKTGNVIAFVNHGGSNSYHEGLATGTPQVLMPAWVDCYDFAGRVQWLGNGVWGNKGYAPDINQAQFTKSLFKVVGKTPEDAEAIQMRDRAKELANIVTENGTKQGSVVAAEHIWDELQLELAKKK
ncbi:uncharacterized protein I303_108017 [Kwoniella dejecticola CBS 10117]|uniref:Erythromycin biosynthesis protein CIII-like C-terminal domain-containing protein n=1 Tax=Kwoniella dejecticola CBS 10117 TaxID=1296121 RepID=A0A1A5ZWB4_9TREE|nr:uncharacterized protein I303_08008 [Kwoniella dejecticola CBS 10117]OBR82094.1 hypothetical protein I303_08008 [Kwoniella dejecticola CBS 10117]